MESTEKQALSYLNLLNTEYHKLHKAYEDLFWTSYMGDHSVDKRLNTALKKRDAFRADASLVKKLEGLKDGASKETKTRIGYWLWFFSCYQTPPAGLVIKEKIDKLEGEVQSKWSKRKEGYIDPHTKKFVLASSNKMGTIMVTNGDEQVRRACFEAREKSSVQFTPDLVKLIKLRNEFARAMGFKDFYDYKLSTVDRMTKAEVFGLFDKIYQKTKYAIKNIEKLEKKMPGLLKPWNFGYMMSGDFIKEEDPYHQFSEALPRWGRSFAAMGITFGGGSLGLDLLERKGKYHNGFCHYPDLVRTEKGRLMPGSANFTCNMVNGQVGSGYQGYHTLFHEGGHAADRLNAETIDVCVNHEYAPSSVAWAETQSMFCDSVFGSVDWASRYAKDEKTGKSYPFELFERQIKKLHPTRPLALNGIMMVTDFERQAYEMKDLTVDKLKLLARKTYAKFYKRAVPSHYILSIPHIYSFESSAYYHGYGLAELAVFQWRYYFYNKYGYIVDNPKVGEEMKKVWRLSATRTFTDFVKMATKRPISADAFIRDVTMTIPQVLERAKQRIKRLERVKPYKGPIKLDAKIRLLNGKEEIANNKKSFEDMSAKYKAWLERK
ncbi:hypothetical protein KW800_01990 [Candidatus Parcubacteria bacterium]|nr:hypothetical protein [Candidatus Parcubacteria bacterium]